MPTEKEKAAAKAARDRADSEIDEEMRKIDEDMKAAMLLKDLWSALHQVNEQMADTFNQAYVHAITRVRVETNKINGKLEAKSKVNDPNITLAGARNVIQKLIDAQQKKADRHLSEGFELLRRGLKGTTPAAIPKALDEFTEAARIMQEIEGKKKIRDMFR